MKMNFFNLPVTIVNDIFCKWIFILDVKNLDSATCNKNDRRLLLSIFSKDYCVLGVDDSGSHNFSWLILRQVKVGCLVVNYDFIEHEFEENTFINQLFNFCSNSLQTLRFTGIAYHNDIFTMTDLNLSYLKTLEYGDALDYNDKNIFISPPPNLTSLRVLNKRVVLTEKTILQMCLSNPCLRNLVIESPISNRSDDLIDSIFNQCMHLTNLTISQLSFNSLKLVANIINNRTHASSNKSPICEINTSLVVGKTAAHETKISVRFRYAHDLVTGHKSVQFLDFSHFLIDSIIWNSDVNGHLKDFFTVLSGFHSIEFKRLQSIDSSILLAITAHNFASLNDFKLTECANGYLLSDLFYLITKCRELKNLSLIRCEHSLANNYFLYLLTTKPNTLQHLTLAHCGCDDIVYCHVLNDNPQMVSLRATFKDKCVVEKFVTDNHLKTELLTF